MSETGHLLAQVGFAHHHPWRPSLADPAAPFAPPGLPLRVLAPHTTETRNTLLAHALEAGSSVCNAHASCHWQRKSNLTRRVAIPPRKTTPQQYVGSQGQPRRLDFESSHHKGLHCQWSTDQARTTPRHHQEAPRRLVAGRRESRKPPGGGQKTIRRPVCLIADLAPCPRRMCPEDAKYKVSDRGGENGGESGRSSSAAGKPEPRSPQLVAFGWSQRASESSLASVFPHFRRPRRRRCRPSCP
mmetsp:Transcript_19528/g.56958  ORF Transcript_19528/g.56958 Transcript_19528/m.56958 type:complete len:243 (-) Transcript_19528:57-785(-)